MSIDSILAIVGGSGSLGFGVVMAVALILWGRQKGTLGEERLARFKAETREQARAKERDEIAAELAEVKARLEKQLADAKQDAADAASEAGLSDQQLLDRYGADTELLEPKL